MRSKLHAFIWQEGNAWVAQCVDVNIASCGASRDEAKANLIEALQLAREPPADSSFAVPAGDFELVAVTIDHLIRG